MIVALRAVAAVAVRPRPTLEPESFQIAFDPDRSTLVSRDFGALARRPLVAKAKSDFTRPGQPRDD